MEWQYAIVAAIGAAVAAVVVHKTLRIIKNAKNPCGSCNCNCASKECREKNKGGNF